ncbi:MULTISPECIES: RNase adapter RapZ [unclassified Ruminococcus]|uniref:RNase adapter RapZ n=1 Tax=unclassified Ruminococcus TaxID=2608920 RepID=UPI00210A7357|nr:MULTISPECIES: RNase adapter RapZ [unclassified Ruminococcus]MCQ4022246.1 RNase adapter RapZ [Ruminococcus sp. zg-924]MCQ4114574.1 RNase adapter RapZ [Ruminococcus sp. zg-921]
MEFLIIAGLSGAGKTVAMHSLEDIGFYCVDNLPSALITTFYDLCGNSNDEKMKRVALVTNIRSKDDFLLYDDSLTKLRNDKKSFKVLFLDAAENVLLTRYKSTRRKHPLHGSGASTTSAAVKLEYTLLEPIKERADFVIDTTNLSAAQLKERVTTLFLGDSRLGFSVTCMSFGFKYGLPMEADLVFDVRCLPNPFYIEELKFKTGLDQDVRDYVLKWEQTKGLYEKIEQYIDYALPLYIKEGKSQLIIAFGCTGGKHRSVTFAGKMYEHLLEIGQPAAVHHRDIRKA